MYVDNIFHYKNLQDFYFVYRLLSSIFKDFYLIFLLNSTWYDINALSTRKLWICFPDEYLPMILPFSYWNHCVLDALLYTAHRWILLITHGINSVVLCKKSLHSRASLNFKSHFLISRYFWLYSVLIVFYHFLHNILGVVFQ